MVAIVFLDSSFRKRNKATMRELIILFTNAKLNYIKISVRSV